jgi:hypothetical protein
MFAAFGESGPIRECNSLRFQLCCLAAVIEALWKELTVKELKTLLSDESRRTAIVNDCVQLVEAEVRSKGGISGIAIKAAFGVVKTLKPRILQEAVDGMIDDFVVNLQPYYAQYQEEGCPGSLASYLPPRAGQVAEALLSISDARARRSKNGTMVKAYERLRPKGKAHVEQAAPGIGALLDKYVGAL